MAKELKNKENKKEDKSTKSGRFKNFKSELKKVVWPTPKELVNSTVAVISIVLITAIIVFFLDVAFQGLNNYGIDKLRTTVSEKLNNKEDEAENNSQEEIVDTTEESPEEDAEANTEESEQ